MPKAPNNGGEAEKSSRNPLEVSMDSGEASGEWGNHQKIGYKKMWQMEQKRAENSRKEPKIIKCPEITLEQSISGRMKK